MLPSLSSSFIFNFPSDYLPQSVLQDYKGFLDQYHLPFDSIIDFLNSTIKSVNFPGFSYDTAMQTKMRGKQIDYRSAKPLQDLATARQIKVVFKSVMGDANYFLCLDIFEKHYLDPEHIYISPFRIIQLDMFRNAMYAINMYGILSTDITENTFDYSVQKLNPKEFTMTFKFNFHEIIDFATKTKIIDTGNPNIIGNSNPTILNL
jgi:hypothetical protein